MDRGGQGQVDVAAAVMMVADGGVVVVDDVEDRAGVRVFTGFDLIVMVIVVVGRFRHGLIGDAGELEPMLDAVLVVDHAMHLRRDHDGHAEADAKEADQSRQVGNSPINSR